eukprot:1178260-Prorocentrum_minimum.AAC.2
MASSRASRTRARVRSARNSNLGGQEGGERAICRGSGGGQESKAPQFPRRRWVLGEGSGREADL